LPIGLKGNSDGSGAIQIGGSDAISISTGLNTTFAGTITASGGVMYPLTSGTAIASTSGTSIDFTGIPSWVKRITINFQGVSLSGTANLRVQLGTSGGVVTSGYLGGSSTIAATVSSANATAGFEVFDGGSAASVRHGTMTITNLTSNTWVAVGVFGQSDQARTNVYGGSTALAGTADRVRITTSNGTDTFDAGTINLLWE
jgi:hypothetical protein